MAEKELADSEVAKGGMGWRGGGRDEVVGQRA